MGSDAELDITYGHARIVMQGEVDGQYHTGILNELKRAIVQTCLAMDTEEARALANRIEGTPT